MLAWGEICPPVGGGKARERVPFQGGRQGTVKSTAVVGDYGDGLEGKAYGQQDVALLALMSL